MGTAERGRAVTATSPDFPRRLRIGSVTVRTRSGRVHGPGGTRQLDPKVVAVLLRLAAAEGHVVSRDTMMADVWLPRAASSSSQGRAGAIRSETANIALPSVGISGRGGRNAAVKATTNTMNTTVDIT